MFLTLLHVWRDEDHPRIKASVRDAWRRMAVEVANRTGQVVEVCDAHGDVVDLVSPAEQQEGN